MGSRTFSDEIRQILERKLLSSKDFPANHPSSGMIANKIFLPVSSLVCFGKFECKHGIFRSRKKSPQDPRSLRA